MKKVLVVLVVVFAMLLVGCPQPAGSSIPDEMTVSSVSTITAMGGASVNDTTEGEVEATIFALTQETVTATKDGDKCTIEPSVVVKKATIDEMIKEIEELMPTADLELKITYTFDNGHLTLTTTYTGEIPQS